MFFDLNDFVTDDNTPDSNIRWAVSRSNNFRVTINGDRVSIRPLDRNFNGQETLTFTVADAEGQSSSDTVNVAIIHVDRILFYDEDFNQRSNDDSFFRGQDLLVAFSVKAGTDGAGGVDSAVSLERSGRRLILDRYNGVIDTVVGDLSIVDGELCTRNDGVTCTNPSPGQYFYAGIVPTNDGVLGNAQVAIDADGALGDKEIQVLNAPPIVGLGRDFTAVIDEPINIPGSIFGQYVFEVEDSVDEMSFEWDFNNDGTSDSDYENPIVTFTQAGTYTVKLTAHSSTSSHSVTHPLVINAGVIDPKVYTLPVSWVEHYTNEFNASGDWTEETTSDYSAAISGGLYTITNYTTENSWFFWTNAVTMPATTDDYDLEIYYKVNYDNVTQGSGLFWGLNSSTFEYYYYRFTPYNGSGYFTIGDKDIAAWSEGHFWEGGNITDYNKITARKYGNSMYFFMNGVYYTTLPFEGNYGNYFGFLIGADAKISIEWIGLWILDEGSKAGKLSKEFTPNMYHGTAGKLFQKVETTLK